MTPTPYPAIFLIVDRWFSAPINAWGSISDGPTDDAEACIMESFKDDSDVADLTTVRVWLHNDAGWRDETEDTLGGIGEYLSRKYSAANYPAAFLPWASDEIKAAVAARNCDDDDDGRYDDEAA